MATRAAESDDEVERQVTDEDTALDLHLYQALALLIEEGERGPGWGVAPVLSAIYAGEPEVAASEMWAWTRSGAETQSTRVAVEELRAAYRLMGLEPPSS